MTESHLVSAQLAYVYPRMAALADLRGDRAFARRLRAAGARNLAVTRREWTGRGWYSRGYAGDRQLGRGRDLRRTAALGDLRGRATGPAVRDPGAQRPPLPHWDRRACGRARSRPDRVLAVPRRLRPARDRAQLPVSTSTGDNNAVFVGGSWYAVNGWLTWALASLADSVPSAREYALDELQRNTLRAHARAYPRHWGGTHLGGRRVSRPLLDRFVAVRHRDHRRVHRRRMHQPTWALFDAIKLAGVEPTRRGYRIRPALPLRRFSLRFPRLGLEWAPGRVRGYVVTVQSARLEMEVRAPSRGRHAVYVEGRRVRAARRGRFLTFRLRTRAGRPVNWAVVG